MKDANGVELDTPPPSVLRERERLRELMEGHHEESEPPAAAETKPALRRPTAEPTRHPAAHRVTMEFIGKDSIQVVLKLQFQAIAVDVGENYISVAIDPELVIDPGDMMDVRLTYQRETYDLVWVGGKFRFPLAETIICGISFLRKSKNPAG